MRTALEILLLFVALVVPPLVAFTRFGFFVSEPRYALPLYSFVPLLAGALWRVPWRAVSWSGLGLILAREFADKRERR